MFPQSASYNLSKSEPMVLFPEPLAPTTAVIDPDGTSKSIPFKTGTSLRDGYVKWTLLKLMDRLSSMFGGIKPPEMN